MRFNFDAMRRFFKDITEIRELKNSECRMVMVVLLIALGFGFYYLSWDVTVFFGVFDAWSGSSVVDPAIRSIWIEYGLLTFGIFLATFWMGAAVFLLVWRKIGWATLCLLATGILCLVWWRTMERFDAINDLHHQAGHALFDVCLGNPIPYGGTAISGALGSGFGLLLLGGVAFSRVMERRKKSMVDEVNEANVGLVS